MQQVKPVLAAALLSLSTAVWAHSDVKHAAPDQAEMVRTAFGQTGDPRKVSRTVTVDMADTMRFSPPSITVRQGDTVRFVARNRGKVMHEMVLGTDRELAEHAELMRKHPDMEHNEPYMAHVGPGKRAEIVWQFTEVGEFGFACLIPGHYEAGMVGVVRVVARKR